MLKIFVLLSVLSAVALARETTECEVKNSITEDTWKNLKKDILNPPQNVLCFLKCVYDRDGVLDSEGKINKAKLDANVDAWVKLSAEEKVTAYACVDSVAPAKTCDDIKPIYLCLTKKKA